MIMLFEFEREAGMVAWLNDIQFFIVYVKHMISLLTFCFDEWRILRKGAHV